ncbi:hypothetical protein HZH66_014377 [Vespula vulgaris]|uniref:Uncharacterized protein n=1 Tax=Vespula vulgaris TaxID=7454 RepID=A0A834J3R6_VESVU|nr:hypothetical protein HZH66_014377 [Vespula vulgaris]
MEAFVDTPSGKVEEGERAWYSSTSTALVDVPTSFFGKSLRAFTKDHERKTKSLEVRGVMLQQHKLILDYKLLNSMSMHVDENKNNIEQLDWKQWLLTAAAEARTRMSVGGEEEDGQKRESANLSSAEILPQLPIGDPTA